MTVRQWLVRMGGLGSQRRTALRRLSRNVALAATIGVAAGLTAVGFYFLCHVVEVFTIEHFAGYIEPGPKGEENLHGYFEDPTTTFRPWMILPVITLGGLISGLLIYKLAPETASSGTNATIDAYHNKRGRMRERVGFVKILATAVTVGTGGSGGREGPIAQIGAGFASIVSNRLKLKDQERRTLMGAGIGAGIGAIFHAPLAGAIFASEVLYREADFEAENLIPAFIATTVAYSVFCLVYGFDRLFEVDPVVMHDLRLLLPFSLLAVVAAFGSFLFVKTYETVHLGFDRLPVKPYLKPMIGAFITGVIAVTIYYVGGMANFGQQAQFESLNVLGVGYGFMQRLLSGELPPSRHIAITLLVLVALGKMLTTSFTVGSGGSAGIFGPSVVIGGSIGALVALILQPYFPNLITRIDLFAILGMAAFYTASANTPVSSLIIVSEMTGNYELLLPSMWVCSLAFLLGRGWTMYPAQVPTRLESPAHRGDFIVDVLQGLTIRDALPAAKTHFITVPLDMPLTEMNQLITDTRQICFPVVDRDSKYYGLFGLNDMREYLYESGLASLAVAEDLAVTNVTPLKLQMDLSSAMSEFAQSPYEELPVVDDEDPHTIIGMLRRGDVIATYSKRLLVMRQDTPPPTLPPRD